MVYIDSHISPTVRFLAHRTHKRKERPLSQTILAVRSGLVAPLSRKRRSNRFLCPLAAIGQLLLPATNQCFRVWLHNVSREGIAVNLSQSLARDLPAVLSLKLTDGRWLRWPARVVHATAEVDGSWRIGCEFAEPLLSEEIEAFLENR